MRDDDLIADGLSEAPQVPLRGVRAVVVAPLVAIAITSAPGCSTTVIPGVSDAPPPDAPGLVGDVGLHYDAGRVDAPRDADPALEDDAPIEDASPPDAGAPLDVG